MRPTISNTPYYMLNVPDLSGGINLRDGISGINDNQLLEAKNLWFEGGVLRTRPALNVVDEMQETSIDGVRLTDIYETDSSGALRRLITYAVGFGIRFFWVGKNGSETAFEELYVGKTVGSIDNVLVFKGTAGYLDTTATEYYFVMASGDEGCRLFRYMGPNDGEGLNWEMVNDNPDTAGYVPTVYLHCKTGGELKGFDESGNDYDPEYKYAEFEGTQFEGYNLINDYYKIIYSTVNPEIIPTTENKTEDHFMKYLLPPDCPFVKNPKASAGKKARVTIKHPDGSEVVHEATINDNGLVTEAEAGKDNLKMTIENGWLTFSDVNGTARVTKESYVADNMEILLPGAASKDTFAKVFGMIRSVWYGGEANGINGGSRLFLCGNEKNGNLVVWSDVNNPAYFPANNFAFVGDASQKVTGFGRQESKLVIFKEREIYYTQYVSDTTITAESLASKSVVDITSSTAYFPIIQLDASIGCDLPDTIQLCDNRLVWANRNGLVYALTSSNQYNENSVYEVSEMLGLEIAKNPELPNAFAVDWDGRYLLVAGNMCYVLEYSSYGFRAISSYGKSEDANKRVVWWIWEFPVAIFGAVSDGNNLTTISQPKYVVELERFDKSATVDRYSDIESKIVSRCQTKYFDFGSPTVKKVVPKASLVFRANNGEEIRITEKTDIGYSEHSVVMDENSIDERDPESLVATLIRPAIKNVRRISLAFESEGNLAIESIMLQYKKIGGLK